MTYDAHAKKSTTSPASGPVTWPGLELRGRINAIMMSGLSQVLDEESILATGDHELLGLLVDEEFVAHAMLWGLWVIPQMSTAPWCSARPLTEVSASLDLIHIDHTMDVTKRFAIRYLHKNRDPLRPSVQLELHRLRPRVLVTRARGDYETKADGGRQVTKVHAHRAEARGVRATYCERV